MYSPARLCQIQSSDDSQAFVFSFMSTIRIFRFIEQLDAFLVTQEYERVATELGLTEWNPVVWIGRLFVMDNDYGEHWFDNWDQREALEEKAKELGINTDFEQLMIVVPTRFADGRDGPCHSPETRKRFWTDVLKSLELSFDLLFDVAREMNELKRKLDDKESGFLADLEERITRLKRRVC